MAQPTIEQFQLGSIDADQMAGEAPDHYESYDIAVFKEGKTINVGDRICRFMVTRDFIIPANFVGSLASSRTVTAATTTYGIRFNGVLIGVVTFTAGTSAGVFSVPGSPGPFIFAPGDWVSVHVDTPDTNQEDISIVIKAGVS